MVLELKSTIAWRSITVSMAIAAIFAANCVIGGLFGCLSMSAISVFSLIALSRHTSYGDQQSPPQWSQFLPWMVCVVSFGVFVALLAPFAELGGQILGLLFLSPLFGTLIYAISLLSCNWRTCNATRCVTKKPTDGVGGM